MEHKNYNAIHKSVRKKDSMQLLLGKPVYTDDITGPALVVKLLRSPHANAIVEEIHTEIAKKIPGVVVSIHGRMCRRRGLQSQVRLIRNHLRMTG